MFDTPLCMDSIDNIVRHYQPLRCGAIPSVPVGNMTCCSRVPKRPPFFGLRGPFDCGLHGIHAQGLVGTSWLAPSVGAPVDGLGVGHCSTAGSGTWSVLINLKVGMCPYVVEHKLLCLLGCRRAERHVACALNTPGGTIVRLMSRLCPTALGSYPLLHVKAMGMLMSHSA